MAERVDGICPMGCGRTLFLGEGGHVTCSLIGCPDPTAVDRLLHIAETEHVVRLGEMSFDVQHPLRERLDDPGGFGGSDLFGCGLHAYLSGLGGPPRRPGLYRVLRVGDRWKFIPLPRDRKRSPASEKSDRG